MDNETKINKYDKEISTDNNIKSDDINRKYKGKWYVVNCYSGHEDRVKEDLIQRVESLNMKDVIFDISVVKQLVPGKKGKKAIEKNMYPGYIFINMIMNDEAWYIVRNTTGITGFIGSSGRGTKPFPLTEQEARNMLTNHEINKTSNTKKVKILYTAAFNVNDYVKILSGPFESMEGQVTKMDYAKGVATVSLELFGRLTPTDVSFSQCELI